ncbi:hypothetical protein CP533_5624 [Ophiocordyceps camponoti-saundersi (nom. inval.)]|nr:hypothetical protein CP533_5624 [Ophiocordyceps camponoti-saundersi (nom. inval.)]
MADDIIVPLHSPTAPILGLSELQSHLEALSNDPALAPDAKLLDQVELQLTSKSPPPENTNPLVFADPSSLLNALRSPLASANLLALAVVGKAASSPAEADKLAELPDIVAEIVHRWLESPHVSVGERAARVLLEVLRTDCGSSVEIVNGTSNEPRPPGHHRIWPLIFENDTNLTLIRNLCTLDHDPSRSTHDITISQGRLLRLLPPLAALDIRLLTKPNFLPGTNQCLLQWAALSMIDKMDMLMHLTLIDFYVSLVTSMAQSPHARDATLKELVQSAAREDSDIKTALGTLGDRVDDDDAPDLRRYVTYLLS